MTGELNNQALCQLCSLINHHVGSNERAADLKLPNRGMMYLHPTCTIDTEVIIILSNLSPLLLRIKLR